MEWSKQRQEQQRKGCLKNILILEMTIPIFDTRSFCYHCLFSRAHAKKPFFTRHLDPNPSSSWLSFLTSQLTRVMALFERVWDKYTIKAAVRSYTFREVWLFLAWVFGGNRCLQTDANATEAYYGSESVWCKQGQKGVAASVNQSETKNTEKQDASIAGHSSSSNMSLLGSFENMENSMTRIELRICSLEPLWTSAHLKHTGNELRQA